MQALIVKIKRADISQVVREIVDSGAEASAVLPPRVLSPDLHMHQYVENFRIKIYPEKGWRKIRISGDYFEKLFAGEQDKLSVVRHFRTRPVRIDYEAKLN